MEDRWTTLSVTTVGIFVASFDLSLLVVGLPTILSELESDLATGSWVITAHRLALVSLLAPAGKLSDTYGRVKLYVLGYFIFSLGALLSALSPSIQHLVLSRMIQGAGVAFIFVNSMAMLTDAFAGKGLGTGFGINQTAINAGTVIGYVSSGLVVSTYGWRALFIIDAVAGMLGGVWARLRLDKNSGVEIDASLSRFDLKGSVTLSISLLCLLYVLTMGFGLPANLTLSLLVTGVALLAVFVWIERRSDNPIIDLRLFRIRTFTVGNISNFLNSMTFASLALLASIYLGIVEGLSPLQVGLTLIPLDLTLIVVGPLCGWLSDRIGTKVLTTLGLIISGIALLLLSSATLELNYTLFFSGLVVAGVGVGMFRSSNANSVMNSVPREFRGIASGVRSMILNLSIALSTPFAIAVIMLTAVSAGNYLACIDRDLSACLKSGLGTQIVEGVRNALIISGVINFIAALISYLRDDVTEEPRG